MTRRHWCIAGAALAALFAGVAGAQPVYRVEPCCELCPAAADRAAYTTEFLRAFSTLVQGRDGWLFRRDDDLRMQFGLTEEAYRELGRFRAALAARGVELAMVYQPPRGLMHADKLPPEERARYNPAAARASYVQTLERLRQLGVVVPRLERLLNETGPVPYFFRGDIHWTPDGARRTAELVAEALRELPAFKKAPKRRFVTERAGLLKKRGSLQRAASMLCGFGYPDLYVDRYTTVPEEGERGLLDETPVPQVSLVGTSHSDGPYNFAGFLSQSLGTEVLNAAVEGGGHDGALLEYLPGEQFQQAPPRILIWELVAYHDLSNLRSYRQLIPSVYGGCRERPVLLSRRAALRRGAGTEVLFNGGGRVLPLLGRYHIVDLQFSDPGLREFQAVAWYTNGSKDTMAFSDSAPMTRKGRFVYELRSEGEWGDRTFLSLDIVLPPTAPADLSVSAKVCARPDAPPQQTAGVD